MSKATFSASDTSAAVELTTPHRLVGVFIPSGFSGTTLDFLASYDAGVTYVPVRDVGGANLYQVTAAASRFVPLDPRVFAGLTHIKLKSSGSETITLSLCVRSID